MDRSIPIKYVLYTHYSRQEGKDFGVWKREKNQAQNGKSKDWFKDWHKLEGIQYLIQHFKELNNLLSSPAYEGLLVVFYAPGFPEFLNYMAKPEYRDALPALDAVGELIEKEQRKKHKEKEKQEEEIEKYKVAVHKLEFAEAAKEYVAQEAQKYGELASRLRFITPLDLYDVFGQVNWAEAERLRWWFMGRTNDIRYDVPKIVEAIVRLRLLGTGLPVFRLDYDVLFRGCERDQGKGLGNSFVPDLGMFKAVASCLRAYQLRRDESNVASFLFSASYDMQALLDDPSTNNFLKWSRAFATRIFPALPVNEELIKANQLIKDSKNVGSEENKGNTSYTWDNYASDTFNPSLARKFYGLDPVKLKCTKLIGIGKIGGHPTVSVISGAMLCISEGAILDLPPFSNFGLNVMWIDDHLKYSLHRELRHLNTDELKAEPLLNGAKLDKVMVEKARSPIESLPEYVLGSYLPSLLWGTVMDAWITKTPLLKYRSRDLSDEDRAALRDISRTGRSQSVLASALQAALEKGDISQGDKLSLKDELREEALKRITEVREQWAALTEGEVETFASVWAKGTVSKYFEGLCVPHPQLGIRCAGIPAESVSLSVDITHIRQLNSDLSHDLEALITYAIDYIEWTLKWPKIVQVVRSIEQGTVRTDISWRQ